MIEWTTFYIGSIAVLLLLGFTQKSDSGRYWRFISLLALAALKHTFYFNDFTSLESIHSTSQFNLWQPFTIISFYYQDLLFIKEFKF